MSRLILLYLVAAIPVMGSACTQQAITRNEIEKQAIVVYSYIAMRAYDYVDALPREFPERNHTSMDYSIRPILPVEQLEPHVIVVDSYATQHGSTRVWLRLDEQGRRMISEWAGSKWTDEWNQMLMNPRNNSAV